MVLVVVAWAREGDGYREMSTDLSGTSEIESTGPWIGSGCYLWSDCIP